jgi:hypothetical protein
MNILKTRPVKGYAFLGQGQIGSCTRGSGGCIIQMVALPALRKYEPTALAC